MRFGGNVKPPNEPHQIIGFGNFTWCKAMKNEHFKKHVVLIQGIHWPQLLCMILVYSYQECKARTKFFFLIFSIPQCTPKSYPYQNSNFFYIETKLA